MIQNTLTVDKILSITCDNASVNDKMIDELKHMLDGFPGAKHQTRCFLHILNLVVKSIIKLFDALKGHGFEGTENTDDLLARLAEGIEFEEEEMMNLGRKERHDIGDDEDEEADDDDDGDGNKGEGGEDDDLDKGDNGQDVDDLENEVTLLTDEEMAGLVESIAPVHLVITKVR